MAKPTALTFFEQSATKPAKAAGVNAVGIDAEKAEIGDRIALAIANHGPK